MTDPADRNIPAPGSVDAQHRRQSFGAWAGEYDRYRPGYPPEIFAYLLERADLTVTARVLDIGAGTGQLSRGFIDLGCDVVAVEPDDRMRAVLATVVGEHAALAGSAESLPLPDASVDAVFCGQMWHWVDPERALPEIARVLRPGGVFGILWNLRDDRVDWVSALSAVVDLPDAYKWFATNDTPALGEEFGPTIARDVEHVQLSSPDDLVGLIGTFSAVGLSDDPAVVLAAIRRLTETHPQLAGRETFGIPYVCKIFTAIRT